MIKVERAGNGYRFMVNDGDLGRYSTSARSVDEIVSAVRHYYAESPQPEANEHVNGTRDDCPLCRLMQKR